MIKLALELGVLGLSGVFGSLLLLFIAVKIIVKAFPFKEEEPSEK